MEKHIIHGVKELSEKRDKSFGQHIYNGLLNGGSKTALVCAITGQEVTYTEIRLRTLTIAQYLKDCGLKENDVITICGPNSLDFFLPAIAALYLGIIVAPISHAYVPREMVHAMNISKPKIIFCANSVLNNIIEASKSVPSIKKIINFGNCNAERGTESLNEIMRGERKMKSYQINNSLRTDHVAAIMCSSGTTGLPKGVMLTHTNFLYCAAHLGYKGYGQLTADKIGMGLLPFFHAYGFTMYLTNIATNMKLIVVPKFEEKVFLQAIEKYKITFLSIVPPLVVFLAKSPLVDRYDVSSLKNIICGAAPLAKDIEDLVKKRLNLNSIRQGYGMTETTLAVLISPPTGNKPGSSGVVAPSMSVKVINPETGETLGPYQEGELCFKGPLIMKQYCGDRQSTSATIDKNGWLHTGDVGYYDEDQYFFIVDRLKELIKYKGFQVPPAELEALLLQNPRIKEAAVIGIPDEKCGELPFAFVVKAQNSNITDTEVIKYIEERVSFHKRLHGGVKFVNDIPKNPSGKILRRILRDSLKTKSKL